MSSVKQEWESNKTAGQLRSRADGVKLQLGIMGLPSSGKWDLAWPLSKLLRPQRPHNKFPNFLHSCKFISITLLDRLYSLLATCELGASGNRSKGILLVSHKPSDQGAMKKSNGSFWRNKHLAKMWFTVVTRKKTFIWIFFSFFLQKVFSEKATAVEMPVATYLLSSLIPASRWMISQPSAPTVTLLVFTALEGGHASAIGAAGLNEACEGKHCCNARSPLTWATAHKNGAFCPAEKYLDAHFLHINHLYFLFDDLIIPEFPAKG